MKKILFLSLILLTSFVLQAAHVTNVPQKVVQPNGDTLYCFASGDEFYHYLHDANGYTIVQDPATGYFVYGKRENGKVVPTQYVAGTVDPTSVGLAPHARISAAEWHLRHDAMMQPVEARRAERVRDGNTNHGDFNNLVIFIHLADDAPFNQTYSQVNRMFNDTSIVNNGSSLGNSTYYNSMYNYFKVNTYNQLFVHSYLVPQSPDDVIVAYEDIYPRAYYMPWSETNPMGYVDTLEDDNRTTREMQLLARAIDYANENNMFPSDVNFDYNNDGLIDNICFIVSGDVAGWSDLLWPHRWSLWGEEVYIGDLRVWDFNFELSDNDWYFSNSTLCHEMSHSLGAPDLYHYYDDNGYTPVGGWDLMAQNASVPQHWGAYMKYRYGNWIEEIPTIVNSGRYMLRPLSWPTPEQVCYRIDSEDPDEFFVIEFRRSTRPFESHIPNGGAVIYRINTNFDGNAGWNGEDVLDEVYVYRPGGTLTSDGQINNANYSQSAHHTEINYSTDPQPFLSNGYISALNIYDVRTYIHDSLTFWYLKPGDTLPNEVRDFSSQLRLYPMPAVTNLSVENNALLQQVEIFDLSGHCVYRAQSNATRVEIAVDRWAAGTYIVRAQTAEGLLQEKITVAR
ncbi:MAG: T9SS type A sorting domain-containing protein [Bacteroidales bacterium]|nr:T9SS type A sorting domain-containing protein [Bacteroidales bacterium]